MWERNHYTSIRYSSPPDSAERLVTIYTMISTRCTKATPTPKNGRNRRTKRLFTHARLYERFRVPQICQRTKGFPECSGPCVPCLFMERILEATWHCLRRRKTDYICTLGSNLGAQRLELDGRYKNLMAIGIFSVEFQIEGERHGPRAGNSPVVSLDDSAFQWGKCHLRTMSLAVWIDVCYR